MTRKNRTSEVEELATQWLTKEEEGLNDFEKSQLKTWLKEESTHKEEYDLEQNLRDSFKTLPKNISDTLKQKANSGAYRTKKIQKIKPFAFAALLLLSLGLGSFKIYDYSNPTYKQAFISKNEIIKEIELPDKSKIVMDIKSKLDITFYQDKREVALLQGRAIFDVSKNKERPFIIKAKNTSVVVVGTRFEVSNIEDIIRVKVKEGIVKVYQNFGNSVQNTVLLQKGEKIALNSKGDILTYGKVDIEKIATWEKGFIVLDETPLVTSIKRFSRYLDLEVKYENNIVEQTLITGKFKIKNFEAFLEALPLVYKLKIIKEKEIIKIVQD